MKHKLWKLQPRLDSDLLTHLLASRQVDCDKRDQFFSPQLSDLVSPFDFPDMERAVERIMRAVAAHESIVVWGDFDCDGVTSTAILWETLFSMGADVKPYIPNRDTEGHGFSTDALSALQARGVTLIISCDHGVTAFDEVLFARLLNMEVIISDHHEPERQDLTKGNGLDSFVTDYTWPAAVAVIHPFRLVNPQALAGCGTAYQLAYALWLAHRSRQDDLASRQEFSVGRIGLAALGTIADMMPLVGDNRVLATFGLRDLARTTRPGLLALMRNAGLTPQDSLTVYDVGFILAPRLNAPGRLADALESLRLLCVKDLSRAQGLAQILNDLNKERQELLARVTLEARAVAVSRPEQGFYCFSSSDWPAGVCGLAAGRLVEELYRPVVVLEEQGETSRGSARSIKGFDMTAGLASVADLLEKFGGHSMAAGFVAPTANLPEIERRLGALVLRQVPVEQLSPSLVIDAAVTLPQLDLALVAQLQRLEPCGLGNPPPLLMSEGLRVVSCRTVGKEAKNLKLTLQDDETRQVGAVGQTIDAIAFGFGGWRDRLSPGIAIDVAFGLEENVWMEKRSVQLKVKDLRLSADR
jgi:single-stranded-DNA-specific exonuclease